MVPIRLGSVSAPVPPTTPALPFSAQGQLAPGGFSSLMRSVQAEVERFIRHGNQPTGQPASLMPHGQLALLRAQQSAPPAGESADQKRFLDSIAPWARQAGQKLGVAPELISAHAALESGWGQRPLRNPDGSDTFNFFGIKAGTSWKGSTVEAATTEYVGGAATAARDRFRSYPDIGSAFEDFASLMSSSPRFRSVLNVGSDVAAYAAGLVRGGYATDPSYAEKLTRIVQQLRGRAG